MISVIIPAYNAEKYIGRAIESILSSSFRNFELIIVNDGSIDNTDKILQHYEQIDNRVKVFNKQNGGSASARNVGISNAKGDYICFVDADDFIDIKNDGIIYYYEKGSVTQLSAKRIHSILTQRINDNMTLQINKEL